MTEDEAFQEAEKYNLMMKEEGEDDEYRKGKGKETSLKPRQKQDSILKIIELRKKIKKRCVSKTDFNKEQDNLKVAFYEKVKNEKPNISNADLQHVP